MARQTPIEWVKFIAYANSAISKGGATTRSSIAWDVSMGCDKPFPVCLVSQPPDNAFIGSQPVRANEKRFLNIETPCRKCPVCLKNRRTLWRRRMQHEIKQSNRTWFATFTVDPHHRFIFAARAGTHDYISSYGELSKEFTKYLKRLRIKGHSFKYIMVAEAHKDGYPHLHALFHEGSTGIPKKVFQAEWPFGFTTFKLCDNEAAHYIAKYLAKDARTRIRASQLYGQSVRDLLAELNYNLNS